MSFKIQFITIFITTIFNSHLYSQDYDTLFLKPGPEEGKDAIIRSIYSNINEGDHFDFMGMAWTKDEIPFTNRSLIEFDLSGIPENSIIHSARLNLYYSEQTGGIGNFGENASYLLKILEEWDEHTVTWNNQPAVSFDEPVFLPASLYQYQNYLNIDVTNLITNLYEHPDLYHGFSLRLQYEYPYSALTFSSSDQTNPDRWPELEVVYPHCDELTASFSYEINDKEVSFTNLTENADEYYWDFGDGFISMLKNPVHTFNDYSGYFVCLTVNNSCSENTLCDTIKVVEPGAISEEKINHIKLFPNPFTSRINIFNQGPDNFLSVKISLYDSKGLKQFAQTIDLPTSTYSHINTDMIDVGFYTLVIESDDFVLNKKIIKIHN